MKTAEERLLNVIFEKQVTREYCDICGKLMEAVDKDFNLERLKKTEPGTEILVRCPEHPNVIALAFITEGE